MQRLPKQNCQSAEVTIVCQNDPTLPKRLGQYDVVGCFGKSQREYVLNIASLLAKKVNDEGMNVLVRQQLAREQLQLAISAVIIVSLLSDWAAKLSASSTSSAANCG